MKGFVYPKIGEVLRDTEGRPYQVVEQLGQGGQGAVFLTRDTSLLAKICVPPKSLDVETVRDRFKVLKLRNLQVSSLILPRATLAPPYLGYVMDRVSNALPISYLVYPKEQENFQDWYQSTGGLRRRLRICAELAQTISEVHRAGLCYVDLSLQNVLVSQNSKEETIYLIDPDNLIVPGTSLSQVLGTPWFIAPELFNEDRFPDYPSDRWALAVLIYYMLVLNHPFMGDMVLDGEPEMEDEALQGRLPFIDSKSDPRNLSSYGLPREKVLTTKLQQAFHQVFTQGVSDRWSRPSPEYWRELLEEAADKTAWCKHCQGTSYLPRNRTPTFFCEWCSQENKRPIEVGFFPPDPLIKDLDFEEEEEMRKGRVAYRFVLDREQRYIPTRLVSNHLEIPKYQAMLGSNRNSQNQLVFGLKNMSAETWYAKVENMEPQTCQPGEILWLWDGMVVLFPGSKVRAKIRNPHNWS